MMSASAAPAAAPYAAPPAPAAPPPATSLPVAPPAPTTSAAPTSDGGTSSVYFDADKFDKAYENVRGMGQIQYELPVPKRVDPPPQWTNDFSNFFGAFADVVQWLIYGLLALLALYILYRLFPPFRIWLDRLIGRARKQKEVEEDEWQPEISRARELLEEAEALAAQGFYAEAVHLLLWRSIDVIGTRRPKLLRPSLTARDIARSPELPDAARGAFTTIADVVELSHFGRRPVDQQGWERCRDAYSRFAQRDNWTANAAAPPPAPPAPPPPPPSLAKAGT